MQNYNLMEFEIGKITEIKHIRAEKSRLSARESALSRPMMEDRSQIKHIYDIFKEVLSQRGCPPRIGSVTQRKKFILLVLYLYAPGVLSGGRIAKGLRCYIAEATNVTAQNIISENLSDVVFLYQNTRKFSADFDMLFKKVTERLEMEGLL